MHECASWLISILFIIMITIVIINTSNKHVTLKKEEELFQEDPLLTDFTARNIAILNADILDTLTAKSINSDVVNTDLLNMTDSTDAICFGYGASGNTVTERAQKCIGPADIINVKNLGTYIDTTKNNFAKQLNEVNGTCNTYNNTLRQQLSSLSGSISSTGVNANNIETRLTKLEQDTSNKMTQFNSQINTINRITIPQTTQSVQATLTDIDGKCSGLTKQITDVKSEFERRCARLEQIATQTNR